MSDLTVFAVVSLVLFVLLIKGVVRTFQRNAIVAILMIIFLMPLYLIWAFIELFLGKPDNSTKVVIVEKDAE